MYLSCFTSFLEIFHLLTISTSFCILFGHSQLRLTSISTNLEHFGSTLVAEFSERSTNSKVSVGIPPPPSAFNDCNLILVAWRASSSQEHSNRLDLPESLRAIQFLVSTLECCSGGHLRWRSLVLFRQTDLCIKFILPQDYHWGWLTFFSLSSFGIW